MALLKICDLNEQSTLSNGNHANNYYEGWGDITLFCEKQPNYNSLSLGMFTILIYFHKVNN